MAEEYDYLFKSIVVGDGGVGKTALTLRFSKGFFTEDYKMTIGVDFHVKTISIDSNEGPIRSKLQIWDTGGQERFSSIRPMYYRGSLGALLIFDLTNSSSFDHLPGWIEEVRANVKNEIPLLLVGNKSDLVDQRAVSLEEINNFTRDFNLYYMETSAKTGEGVGDCFYILACLMIGSGVPDQHVSNGIVFNPGQITPMDIERGELPSPRVKNDIEYSAPPVPEPFSSEKQGPSSSLEPEPEFEFSAPPVPEPPTNEQSNLNTPFESEFEPEIPLPEPKVEEKSTKSTEFEFKTPEDILAEEESSMPNVGRDETPQEHFTSSSNELYTPKATPFTPNIPVPAPTPEGFQINQKESSSENPPASPAPFLPSGKPSPSKSNSLVDYMAEPVYSKKDKKKMEKQKKKEEKDKKIQEEKERQRKIIEEMKKVKKEKKEKPKKAKKEKSGDPDSMVSQPTSIKTPSDESTKSPSLFQALTQKDDEPEKVQSSSFIPFSNKGETQNQEKSKLRIIPNAADIETKPSSFTPIQSIPQTQDSSNKKELIICKNCGAMLSSDYTFCNKCGSQL
ncbi:MAG: GTP-binding protein [Promethearchaeota archaeon]|jgi:Ras-related protein Rab-11A